MVRTTCGFQRVLPAHKKSPARFVFFNPFSALLSSARGWRWAGRGRASAYAIVTHTTFII